MTKETILRDIFDFKLKSKKIEYDGYEIEIREPTLRQKNEHLFKSIRKDDENSIDNALYLALAAIDLTFLPNTDQKLFDATHLDSLLNLPDNSILSKIGAALLELNTDVVKDKKKS